MYDCYNALINQNNFQPFPLVSVVIFSTIFNKLLITRILRIHVFPLVDFKTENNLPEC